MTQRNQPGCRLSFCSVDDESEMGKKLRDRKSAKAARDGAQPPNLLIIDLRILQHLQLVSPVRRMYLAALHYSNLFTLLKSQELVIQGGPNLVDFLLQPLPYLSKAPDQSSTRIDNSSTRLRC